MGTADQVLRYRRSAAARWAPAALAVLATFVLVAAAAVAGDAGALPVTIATCLATAAVATGLIATSGVTISPSALIVSSPRGRRTIPWPEIQAVEARGAALWVRTCSGWHALPLPATTPASPGTAGSPLGPEVWAAWFERRGADWRAEGLAPWTPAMDLRGRVVLRPPIEAAILVAGTVVGSLAANALGIAVADLLTHVLRPDASTSGPTDPWAPLVFNLLVLTVAIAVVAAVHGRTRVAIDHETVHIRTIGRTRQIPRASIIGLREVSGGLGFDQRLAIDHGAIGPDGIWSGWTTRLPGPANSTRFFLHDPGFYAKWAWLYDELVVAAEPSRPMIDDRAS